MTELSAMKYQYVLKTYLPDKCSGCEEGLCSCISSVYGGHRVSILDFTQIGMTDRQFSSWFCTLRAIVLSGDLFLSSRGHLAISRHILVTTAVVQFWRGLLQALRRW